MAASGPARWLAPIAASGAVLATLLVPGLVAGGGGAGGGPSPDRVDGRLLPPDRLVLPDPMPHEGRDGRVPRGVEITGYHGSGRALVLFYRVGPRSDCSTEVEPPRVVEQDDRVSVRLVRSPTVRPEEACADLPQRSSVEVRLDGPLGGRTVQDLARRGALVPIERPFSSTP